MSTPASLPYAFVAKIVAADGQHDAVADLLAGAVELANEEVGTIVWFAVRTDADTFWIFDAFPDEAARDAHAPFPLRSRPSSVPPRSSSSRRGWTTCCPSTPASPH